MCWKGSNLVGRREASGSQEGQKGGSMMGVWTPEGGRANSHLKGQPQNFNPLPALAPSRRL